MALCGGLLHAFYLALAVLAERMRGPLTRAEALQLLERLIALSACPNVAFRPKKEPAAIAVEAVNASNDE
jgi:hypothetical protein